MSNNSDMGDTISFLPGRKTKESKPKTVNIFLGFFFMVNFVLGTGFLGVPFSFYKSGIIAGAFTLVCISIITWMSALWEVETMARAQAVDDIVDKSNIKEEDTAEDILTPKFHITITRKFEPSELCEIFIGKWLKIVYLVVLTIYSFLACLSYSTVAGSAWSVNIPLNFGTFDQCNNSNFHEVLFPKDVGCGNAYRFCVFLFGVIVIPLSLLSLKEQAVIQLLLGLMRFGTLGGIIVYCLYYLIMGHPIESCANPLPHAHTDNFTTIARVPPFNNFTELDTSTKPPGMEEMAVTFSFNGWVASVPVFVYAHILHQGIPGLTHPIKQKAWLGVYFHVLFLTIGLIYLFLGLVVVLWYRDCINEVCTLNWEPLSRSGHSVPLRIFSFYLILFPSLDVCSAFPLVIHTIVNNMYSVIFQRDTTQDTSWKMYFVQLMMKFVASLFPILVALLVSNLVYVLKYAGLFGFLMCFYFPITLQLCSQWKCRKLFHKRSLTGSGDIIYGHSDSLSDSHGSGLQVQNKSKKSPEEVVPLLNGDSPNTPKRLLPKKLWFLYDIFEFLFRDSRRKLYFTPYSGIYSYPLVVLIGALIGFVCVVLTIISLFVSKA